MPSKLTTRITWLSDEELRKAKEKAKKHKNFSEFIRFAVASLPKKK